MSVKSQWFGVLLLCIALTASGWMIGSHNKPDFVQDTSKSTHTETQLQTINNETKIDTKELAKLIMQQVVQMMEKRNVATHKETTVKPDGTTTVVEDTTDKSEINTHTDTKLDFSVEKIESILDRLTLLDQKLKLDEETKFHTEMNDHTTNYQVAVQLGYNFAGFLGHHESYNLIPMQGVVAQIQFEKRFWGSLWWTAWLQSTGIGGLGLKLER